MAIRAWQVAFILGLIACIVMVSILGPGLLTAMTGVVGLIITVLNSLLGSSSGGKEGSWVNQRLKRALNVSPLLKLTTIGLWVAALGLVTWGGAQAFERSQLVTVRGLVLTDGGSWAKGAEVSMRFGEHEVNAHAPDGEFSFPGLDKRKLTNLVLVAQWVSPEGEKLDKTIDVPLAAALGGEKIKVTLPAETPPFKVTYLKLGGRAVDLLVRGELPVSWVGRSTSRLYVARTPILGLLEDWMKQYQAEPGETFFDGDLTKPGATSEEAVTLKAEDLPQAVKLRHYFVGTQPNLPLEELQTNLYSKEETSPYLAKLKPWNLGKSYGLWKFAGRSDLLAMTNGAWSKFLARVTQAGVPPDFAMIDAVSDECAGNYLLTVVPRIVEVRVVVFETTRALSFGRFSFRINRGSQFRAREADQQQLTREPLQQDELFPRGLMAGEMLVVPIEILFTAPSEVWEEMIGDVEQTEETSMGEMSFDELRKFAGAAQPAPSKIEESYVYGPSMALEAVETNGWRARVRQYDASRMFISSGYYGGSCPFVYTRSGEGHPWQSEGHIIYGLNAAAKERWTEKRLKRFSGQLLIREHDPEVSYLDSAEVVIELADGRLQHLYPRSGALRAEDGDYARLHQGQELLLEFGPPPKGPFRSVTLRTKGFYIPYDSRRADVGTK